jgi:hypothetical protein
MEMNVEGRANYVSGEGSKKVSGTHPVLVCHDRVRQHSVAKCEPLSAGAVTIESRVHRALKLITGIGLEIPHPNSEEDSVRVVVAGLPKLYMSETVTPQDDF